MQFLCQECTPPHLADAPEIASTLIGTVLSRRAGAASNLSIAKGLLSFYVDPDLR